MLHYYCINAINIIILHCYYTVKWYIILLLYHYYTVLLFYCIISTIVEGGLVKKGEFREGTHTAHGDHRSKTICRKNIGVCAFDPHGYLLYFLGFTLRSDVV